METVVPELNFGVYDSTYDKITDYVHQLADAAPGKVSLSELCKSRYGEPVWMLSITDFSTGLPENKPAILIFANMHCHELSGPIAALRTARGLLVDDGELLKDTAFYIIPRINPDSTEAVIRQSGYTRSRWDYGTRANTFHNCDIDGDGTVRQMRIECPWGNMCEDPDSPGRMIPRKHDSKGPFYFTLGEGRLINWDGVHMTAEEYEGTNRDWNRNWPMGWKPSATNNGDFPLSEPEMYSLATFMAAHPNLYGAINYHNGYGGVLTPKNIVRGDDEFMHHFMKRASELTGYPVCPDGTQAFKNMRWDHLDHEGQFDDTSYHYFGLITLTIELGTYENSSGWKTEDILAHEYDSQYDPLPAMLKYQKAHPDERHAVAPWKKAVHPQFGDVEVGGVDCVGLASPAPEFLKHVCDGVYQFTREFGAIRPLLKVADEKVEEVASGVYRIRLVIQNAGDLPTNVLTTGKTTAWRHSPYATVDGSVGVNFLSAQRDFRMGHIGPWGHQMLEWFVSKKDGMESLFRLRIDGGAAGQLEHVIRL